MPVVHDARLQLTLFAADPEIFTPIGIAVDAEDRIFVLESHTHLPPPDYEGPPGDRVKVFIDYDGDGSPDVISIFADAIEDGMNLAFSPAGELYLVTAREVWTLDDRDDDGVSESRRRVLHLAEPEQVYDHAALLGLTFSADGWMYVSRGNTGGQAWRLVGSDGSVLSGYGDGGNIVRARPDGSHLQEFATGFWNPFDLAFDSRGRLLAPDNDPDSRGPNRLVHVVEGGDYGYKSLYGGSGIHPYLAWNGELPGTLPYALGLGEAPSGILNADLAALPADYNGEALVTIWEESSIVRVRTVPRGVSVGGESRRLIDGGSDFHPVALAADGRGNIYITDWVIRDYPNHGRGRIWRLSAATGVETTDPRPSFVAPDPDPGVAQLRAIAEAGAAGDFERLLDALAADDPFVRSAGVTALARPAFLEQLLAATDHPDPDVRTGALLALRRSPPDDREEVVRRLLADPDPQVRMTALIWAGSAGMTSLHRDLERAIISGPATPDLFAVYLATVQQTTPDFVRAYRAGEERYASDLERVLPRRFLESLVEDQSRPADLRRVALQHLPDPAAHGELLIGLVRTASDPALRLEAVRSLAFASGAETAAALLDVARNPQESVMLRAEALAALARQPAATPADVLPILHGGELPLQIEVARYLSTRGLDAAAHGEIAARESSLRQPGADEALLQQLAFLGNREEGRPTTPEGWERAAASGGDAARGRRVFFSPRSACAQCHIVERRGGDLGPDLTNVGRSKSRDQLIRAILHPSEEVSPEYQGWYIETPDGRVHHGRQIDIGERGAELYVAPGRFVHFEEFRTYGTAEHSLMPEGLQQNLTVAELRDLITFLEQHR